jgi:hypothetical protein
VTYGNEPTREPDVIGRWRAWRVAVDRASPDWAPDHEADCGSWLVDAPGAHPFWWWYVVGCVHLRPMEGVKAPHVQFPGATHEILFCALSPEKPLPSLDDWKGMAFLEPLDLVHQVIVPSDDDARNLTEMIVRHMVGGRSPDSDWRSYWQTLINTSAEHLRLGGHPE